MVENKRNKIKTRTSPRKSPKRSPKRKSPKRKSPKRKVTKLPQLRDLSSKDHKDRNKKYKYHIHESDFKRRRAINDFPVPVA